jgi:hypothetical protein
MVEVVEVVEVEEREKREISIESKYLNRIEKKKEEKRQTIRQNRTKRKRSVQ